jgi:hypothetical protein
VVSPQGLNAGSTVGAMVGGALIVLAVIGIAIRFRIVSAQINGTPQVASWRMMKKTKKHDFEIGTNPTIINNPSLTVRVERINSIRQAPDV